MVATQRSIRHSAAERRTRAALGRVTDARPPEKSRADSPLPSLRIPQTHAPAGEAADAGGSTPGSSSVGHENASAGHGGHPGTTPSAIAEMVSLWSALYAFPTIIITTLDLPVSVKLFWLFWLLVPAALITLFINKRPGSAKTAQPVWQRAMKRAPLPMAAVASIVLALLSVRAVEGHIPAAQSLGCVAVGSGNSDYAEQFQTAYASAGGSAKLGCA